MGLSPFKERPSVRDVLTSPQDEYANGSVDKTRC